MFTKTAEWYDAIYGALGKDYAKESDEIAALIEKRARRPVASLLDVACGTGRHLEHLRRRFGVEGLDLDEAMLAIASERAPGVPLHVGDMESFDLGRPFDAVVCLFSSIGYARTIPALRRTIANLARHLAPGGVLVLEPWLTPEMWKPGHVGAIFVDQPDLKIARINTSVLEAGLTIIDFQYLVGTPEGVRHLHERHELGIFAREDYLAALRDSGIDAEHDPAGCMGRGRFVGVRRGWEESAG